MIHQIDMSGKDKVDKAIERIQHFAEMFDKGEGYFLAFSGGKDSVVIKTLADMAGVKYDAHYSVTTVDPPKLMKFIEQEYPDVIWDRRYWDDDGRIVKKGQQITMWNLIPEKQMPPTRLARYCCQHLKESSGDGRLTMTGVRWAESSSRKQNQGLVTIYSKGKRFIKELEKTGANFLKTDRGGVVLNQDNEESREVVEYCYQRRKTVLNPIIDWTNEDVWEFIHDYNVPYCSLYDEGCKRVGCIGCPMGNRKRDFERYPRYKELYMNAFARMLEVSNQEHDERWKTVDDVFNWWISR